MSRIAIIFLFLFLFSCSTQEDVIINCKGMTEMGALYKGDMRFLCPFIIQKKTADSGWIDYDSAITVLAYDVGDYFPLKRRNSPYTYRIKMKGLKKYFTEEQYTVPLWTADKNYKTCGETREFVFYKIAENADSVEYNTVFIDSIFNGKYLFFGEREMPSYDWYHVLKVCDGRKTGFTLMGEIKE